MVSYNRKGVIKIGSMQINEKPFQERGLYINESSLDDAPKYFNDSRAIIFSENSKRMGFLRNCIEVLQSRAEDYGLSFVILAESTSHFHQIEKYWEEIDISDEKRIYYLGDVCNAAEYIIRKDPGPPLGNPEIQTSGFRVTPEIRFLLRRAFHDCGKLHVTRLVGGKNSLHVFSVEAWLKISEVGPRPLPFFMKVAKTKKIQDEQTKYVDFAEFYIPFHLRPNLARERCVEIHNLSTIVGNLVDDAMPLRQALRSGNGTGSIFSLFETSLKGFRFQPRPIGRSERKMEIGKFLQKRIRSREISARIIRRAQEFGLTMKTSDMEKDIFDAVEMRHTYCGPCHGDLHSANILIRGRDAILIDFSSVGEGPLTADPAALEVSLVFGTDERDKPDSFSKWRYFVDSIYGISLGLPTLHEDKPNPCSWLRRPVRELRHILLGCNSDMIEVKIMIAAYLMRYARLDLELVPKDLRSLAIDRHAYALVIAERIITSLALDGRRRQAS